MAPMRAWTVCRRLQTVVNHEEPLYSLVRSVSGVAHWGRYGSSHSRCRGASSAGAVLSAMACAVVAVAHENDGTALSEEMRTYPASPVQRLKLDSVYEVLDEILGEGGYCVVRKGLDKRTGEPVAIKVLSKKDTSAKEFWAEVDVLKTAGSHPNIMQLRDVFETEEYWYIVQELASDGELFDHLVANGPYSEKQASRAMRDLCQALHFLHRKGIVHGDIKPENILLHDGRMCLVDFGVSFRMGDAFLGESQLTGTVAYAAPETLRQSEIIESPNELVSLGPKADMFALGIVLYILLCGSHPFDPYNNLTDEEIKQRIVKGKFRKTSRAWQSVSPQARDLIGKLLEPDPDVRLSSTQALVHPWLRKDAVLSEEPMPESADLLARFQRGRRRLRASILGALLLGALDGSDSSKLDERPTKQLHSTWGLGANTDEHNEKTHAMLSTLDVFDQERKGFITKSDLARVSERLGRSLSESELEEMIVGSTGDPEHSPENTHAIGYENVKMAISSLRSATYAQGEVIIREGNTCGHRVYLLLDGEVEVSCKNPIQIRRGDVDVDESGVEFVSLKTEQHSSGGKEDIILKRLRKGSFFGEVELLRPGGRLHPRIATYKCAESSSGPCKVLSLIADDFLNVSGSYSTINARLESNARLHTREQLIKCIEAAKGSIRKRSFPPGAFVYREGEVCDSFYILLDGDVEVLKQNEGVVVEELHPGDYFPLGVSGQTQRAKIITRHSSVRCKSPVSVLEIGGETFRSFLHSHQFTAAYFGEEVKTREEERSKRLSDDLEVDIELRSE